MDQSGGLVTLPYDLTLPYARFFARTNISKMKRFCIDKVYRTTGINSQPLQPLECDFDIIQEYFFFFFFFLI